VNIKVSYASIRIGGGILPIESIAYSEKVSKGELCGASPKPLGKSTGDYRASGSIIAGVKNQNPLARDGEVQVSEIKLQVRCIKRRFVPTVRGPVINRLRKYIRRNGNLMSVRTRGRTGYRTVEEATEAAS